MDIIKIENLEVFAKHGVLEEEKSLGQKFLISMELYTDLRLAGETDDLKATIDYGRVCMDTRDIFTQKSFDLIEAAAESLAGELLLRFKPLLKEITVTVKKPWAPVGMSVEHCGVSIHRKWHSAFLSIGSNMGDKAAYLQQAIEAVLENEYCILKKQSSVLETKPYGKEDQEDFLNAACELETLLTPVELLQFCNKTEEKAGRVRDLRWGPRTLDMDIIFYDDIVMDSKEPWLTIPHADMHNREFVLAPLNEIAPGYIHPIYRESVRKLYERVKA